MKSACANYEREQALYRGLFAEVCETKILFYRGESGTGKTTLLQACQADLQRFEERMLHVPIQLRSRTVGVAEIFYRLAGRVGWEQLPRFRSQVEGFQNMSSVSINSNFLVGDNQKIAVALHGGDPADGPHRRAALTDAWFGDLEDLPRPLLLLIDTYEAANHEVRDWIAGPFLGRAAHVERMRVILAGREVPDANNIEWGSCCRSCDLTGILNARHWLPVVEAMNRYIDVPDPLSWLTGVCQALDGRPKDIMQLLEFLPQRGQT